MTVRSARCGSLNQSRAGTIAVLSAFVATIACTTAAYAGPMCFDPQVPLGQPGSAIVKSYSRPGRGTCKPFVGWALFYSAAPITGAACLNQAGDTLRVGYTIHMDYPLFVNLELPYPSLVGGRGAAHSSGSTSSSIASSASASPCVILMP